MRGVTSVTMLLSSGSTACSTNAMCQSVSAALVALQFVDSLLPACGLSFFYIAFCADGHVLKLHNFDDLISRPSKQRFWHHFVSWEVDVRYVGPCHIMVSVGNIDSIFPNVSQGVFAIAIRSALPAITHAESSGFGCQLVPGTVNAGCCGRHNCWRSRRLNCRRRFRYSCVTRRDHNVGPVID